MNKLLPRYVRRHAVRAFATASYGTRRNRKARARIVRLLAPYGYLPVREGQA